MRKLTHKGFAIYGFAITEEGKENLLNFFMASFDTPGMISFELEKEANDIDLRFCAYGTPMNNNLLIGITETLAEGPENGLGIVESSTFEEPDQVKVERLKRFVAYHNILTTGGLPAWFITSWANYIHPNNQ